MAQPTTTAKGIVLALGSYTLTITKVGRTPGQYPRIDLRSMVINRSIRGTPGRRGPISRPPAIWDFEPLLTLDQYETWERMKAVYWDTPQAFTIYDYTRYWSENGTSRTRAIAPNSTEASDGTTILYYPQWKAEPTDPDALSQQNSLEDRVTMQFTETEVVAA